MEIEYYFYSDAIRRKTKWYPRGDRKYTSILDIKQQLPDYMIKEFIHPPKLKSHLCIHIETKKKEIINYFEENLKGKKVDYIKTRYIEATTDEIDNYDYYYIDLNNLEWGKHVDYEFTRPTCKTFEACPWGSNITSPTRIKSKYTRNLDLGKIIDIWHQGQRFVISQKLKSIFESEGVTGLKYEPCLVEYTGDRYEEKKSRFYVAEIIPTVAEEADDIYLHKNYFCKKHSIILRYDGLINKRRRRKAISQDDFQIINRINVKERLFFYRLGLFFISRKVLKILFSNKISDLRERGIYFKNGLVPVPFDDCNNGEYRCNKNNLFTSSLVKQRT